MYPIANVCRRRVTFLVLITLVYALITIALTYPVIAQLDSHVVSTGDDTWIHYWNGWWVKKALSEGHEIQSTDLLFHPQSTSLVYHNFAWFNIACWLLLEPILGGIGAFNSTHLLNITLCAIAAYLLMENLVGSRGPAFIAGLVHGYWPYRLTNYNHPNTISTQWLPLAILCAILLVRERELKYAVLGGILLALTGLSRWQMLLPAAIGLAVYLLFSALSERQSWSRQTVVGIVIMGLVTVLLIAAPLYPLVAGVFTSEINDYRIGPDPWDADNHTDLLSYVVPPQHHPLADLFRGLRYSHQVRRFGYTPSAFLGYAVCALVLFGALHRWKTSERWVVMAAAAFFLSLGPILLLNGVTYPAVPMPYRLVGWTPPMEWMNTPHRFNVLLAVPMSVLAGYGAAALGNRISRQRRPWWWVVLSLLILFDYINLPTAMVEADVPTFYQSLADDPSDAAIVGLPGSRDDAEYYMYYQTVHGHPLLTGHISRLPRNALDFASSVPMLDETYWNGSINTELPGLSHQLQLLNDAGFDYIVLHKDLASAKDLAEWRSYLTMSPQHENEHLVVYPTDPVIRQDYSLQHRLTDEIGLIKTDLSREVVNAGSVLEIDVAWGSTHSVDGNLSVRVSLVDENGQVKQAETYTLSPSWPPDEWPTGAIARENYVLQIDPFLADGDYAVVTQLIKRGQPVGRSAIIGEIRMMGAERHFASPPLEHRADVEFGQALKLLGYDIDEGGERIEVTLHWRALKRMRVAYKFFVHLHDSQSGELVAQADTMPRDWTYPTTWWEKGEVVSDRISLSVTGLPAGRYRLALGVYAADTGRRLRVTGPRTRQIRQDRSLVLPQVVERRRRPE